MDRSLRTHNKPQPSSGPSFTVYFKWQPTKWMTTSVSPSFNSDSSTLQGRNKLTWGCHPKQAPSSPTRQDGFEDKPGSKWADRTSALTSHLHISLSDPPCSLFSPAAQFIQTSALRFPAPAFSGTPFCTFSLHLLSSLVFISHILSLPSSLSLSLLAQHPPSNNTLSGWFSFPRQGFMSVSRSKK